MRRFSNDRTEDEPDDQADDYDDKCHPEENLENPYQVFQKFDRGGRHHLRPLAARLRNQMTAFIDGKRKMSDRIRTPPIFRNGYCNKSEN
ncbi:MAG: hypothetical protein C4325_01140 [Blastocatellia bacterium]